MPGSPPVLLVFRESPPQGLVEALGARGYDGQTTSPLEAVQRLSCGQAALVVCEMIPGWQALVSEALQLNGGAVLWGAEPTTEDFRRLLLPKQRIPCGTTVESVAAAIAEEHQRVLARAQHPPANDWMARAVSAERINTLAQLIAAKIYLPHVIQEAIARTRELCDADSARLLLVDPNTGELCFDIPGEDITSFPKERRLRPGEGIAGAVALSATSVLVPDASSHPAFSTDPRTANGFAAFGSVLAVPLLLGGDILGVLEAVRHRDRDPFEPAHLALLEALSPHITIAVHHALTMDELYRSQKKILAWNADLEDKVRERTEQINLAKKEWEQTFDAINEPLALQEGFVIRRANLAYAQKVGVPLQELPGKTCYRVFAKRDTPCPSCPLLAGSDASLMGEVRMRDDQVFDFSGFRMARTPNDSAVVVHYRDVTHQKHLETRLRESERLAAVGQLASGAAHEINNPLGFLISNLNSLNGLFADFENTFDALKDGLPATVDLDESLLLVQDGREMIGESLHGAKRVAAIVRGLRELSRQTAQNDEPASLAASISRAVQAELSERLSDVSIKVENPFWVTVPPLQMDQVLGQVLRNARQATRSGQHILIQATQDTRSGQVVLEVTDEGCGISKEHVHRVFEPFFTTRGVGNGIGLGLTAAYGIIKRYGGTIDVESEPTKGSTFRMRLPVAERVHTPMRDTG